MWLLKNPHRLPGSACCLPGTAVLIERTRGDFLFYEEGLTVEVGRVIEALDTERGKIAEALGVRVMRDPELGIVQGY